jgi:methane monooxygenase PmoA-like
MTHIATLQVRHDIGMAVTASLRGTDLMSYVYGSEPDPWECPAPFFHPVRTTAGNLVTAHRPHGHRWHKGLAMTISHLSGDNFWGGNSYVRGEGYQRLANVGSLRHVSFSRLDVTEQVRWVNSRGEHWIDEHREFGVHDVDEAAGTWELTFTTVLTNVSGEALAIGSPSVFGREMAGYSGFFWRGPRDLTGGTILAAGGLAGPDVMGARAEWLAYTGPHDVVDASSTVVVVPDPLAEDSPPVWFVRNDPFPAINPLLAFADEMSFMAGDTLRRRYRVVIADGAWDAGRTEKYLAAHPW